MTPEQKAAAYDRLLKAIDDKRLAVVPCEPTKEMKEAICWYKYVIMTAEDGYKDTISAVDQQEILKGLEDE